MMNNPLYYWPLHDTMGRTRKRRSKMTEVIDAWTFLEMLIPRELPSRRALLNRQDIQGGKDAKKMVPLSQSTRIKKLELANPEKQVMYYRYYINTYLKHDFIVLLRNYFQSAEQLYNRQYGDYYAFTFEVNKTGEYISGSLFIPHVQLMIDDIQKKNKISYHDFIERYNEKMQRFEEEFEAIVVDGIDESAIQEIQGAFQRYFTLLTKKESYSYIECVIQDKDKLGNFNHFNSFFLEDLQMISKQGINDTLAQFIEGQALEVDINENREAIEAVLAIDNLPLGRWPSPVEHRLSLMQQVAVNQILNGDDQICSVNGPPGTGKTTLLKDIFAELIVRRATAMVEYENPRDAFTSKKGDKQQVQFDTSSDPFNYNVYELDPEIAKYSMIVASANNGAVENLSKELPLLEEAIRYEDAGNKDNKKMADYHQAYAKEAEAIDLFRDYAEELLEGEEAWGLFSGAFGKASNIEKIQKVFKNEFSEDLSLSNYLIKTADAHSWENAVNAFNDLREEIEADQEALKAYVQKMQEADAIAIEVQELPTIIQKKKKRSDELEEERKILHAQQGVHNQRIENLPNPGLFKKIKALILGPTEEVVALKNQLDEVLEKLAKQLDEQAENKREIKELQQKKVRLDKKLVELEGVKEKYQDEGVVLSDDAFWAPEYYEERQVAAIWQSHDINFKRGLLFLKAMKVHKVFLQKSNQQVKLSLAMFQELKSNNLNVKANRVNIEKMWKILHLVVPLMSTTFASFSSMYDAVGANFIDYLFIDEAGQARPQEAAGALWRSKRAIVVGDPIQIEPVVTLDQTIMSDIREAFNVQEHQVGTTASVQVMADYANPIGTYKDQEKNERIGIPLWVHRRCLEPMFSIANKMAYDNKMVLATHGKEKTGGGEWYEVTGKAGPAQYVKEQGQFIAKVIRQHFVEAEEGTLPSVFVITPFNAIQSQLKKLVSRTLKEQYPEKKKVIDQWIEISIGTVHTFQGKEADIVYFVTGTDEETDGAANWTCMKPNLLNVATTRAKKEFYVVGDLKRFKEKQYYNIIVGKFEKFRKEE